MVMGYPCNNFLFQEPYPNDQILANAQKNFGATFPMYAKLKCEKGRKKTHPLYIYLRAHGDPRSNGKDKPLAWNFTKYLCNSDGVPVKRFEPSDNPLSFEKDILELLR